MSLPDEMDYSYEVEALNEKYMRLPQLTNHSNENFNTKVNTY